MYFALNEKTAVDYVRSFPDLTEILGKSDDLTCVDLAEGNINLIFRVYSARDPVNRSILVKQALPHSRRYPEFKMPLDRARIEYELLQLEAKYCPEMVPRLYRYDPEMHLNIMEDLNRHLVSRYGLMRQIR